MQLTEGGWGLAKRGMSNSKCYVTIGMSDDRLGRLGYRQSNLVLYTDLLVSNPADVE